MAYSLEEFCNDTRARLTADASREGVEKVRMEMERLITDSDFIAKYFHSDIPYGVRTLFVDPELGFHVLGYRAEKTRTSPAHDHGDSWALYGQVRDYTEMTEYNRVDDGSDPSNAKLEIKSKYKLNPGDAHLYWGSQLHLIVPFPPGGNTDILVLRWPSSAARRCLKTPCVFRAPL